MATAVRSHSTAAFTIAIKSGVVDSTLTRHMSSKGDKKGTSGTQQASREKRSRAAKPSPPENTQNALLVAKATDSEDTTVENSDGIGKDDATAIATANGAAKSTPKKKQQPNKRASAPERKKFKITTMINQPNRSAWQIKGIRLKHGLLGFYIQKSINTELEEQPFLFNLVSKMQRYPYFRQQELGVLYMGPRADADGNLIPATSDHPNSEWYLFLAAEKDVGTIETWLEAVCNRLNEDDIAGNDAIFKWKVAFDVTHWGGNGEPTKKLCEVLPLDNASEMVAGLHGLTSLSGSAEALDSIDLDHYFEDSKTGKAAIIEHLQKTAGRGGA